MATIYETHKEHKRQKYMPSVRFEPAIPGTKTQTLAKGRAGTGIGGICFNIPKYITLYESAPSYSTISP
jgi:hypothetical protein